MVTGRCNCGDVEFKISVSPEDVYICHCSICRRNTGGPGVAVTLVNNSDFHWLRGLSLINTWIKPGHDWHCSFCINCGSALPGKNDEDNFYVPVSLLDKDLAGLQVSQHLFVASKASWEVIADDGNQNAAGFEN
jgi:hypothetical protein